MAAGGRGAVVFGSEEHVNEVQWMKIVSAHSLALIVIKSVSSNLSPVMGSVPFSVMYLRISLRS